MTPLSDRRLRGCAEIFTRAMRWKHLPPTMTFEHFVAASEHGLADFFVDGRMGDGSEKRFQETIG